MLDGIRKASKNWLGRAVLTVIMGILVLSFAIWGVGDMLRVTGGVNVARVGSTDISGEQMRTAYNTALEDVSQRLRRRLTSEEARAFGLDRQVLSRLMSEAAMDQRIRKLGLNLSDEEVVRQVMNDPNFRAANGQFDRAKFFEALRQAGLSEAGFFAEQKRALLRRQLSMAIAGDVTPSQALVDAAYRYSTEQRAVRYFDLSAAQAGEIAPPDEATLKAYFEANKVDFRAPEYRKVNLLAALPRELGLDLTVTDADLRRVYDRLAATGQLGAPEKRQVSQILFPTEAEAAAAAEKLKAGTSFEALLEERKIRPADADLGLRTQREFADAAIGKEAFELSEGAMSTPVKTQFGYAIIRVEKVEAGTLTPFDTAKANLGPQALADKLRSDPRIQGRLDDIQRKVDEAKVAGKSLAEAAPATGLALRTIDAIDKDGRDKAGAPVAVPGGEETVKGIFQSDIGLDNEAIRPRDGGLVWFEIAGVEPARDRPFEEVKAEVLLRWKADESGKRLAARAADYVKRLDAGEDIATLAQEAGTTVKDALVGRNGSAELGATGSAQAFAIPVGKAANAAKADGSRVVLKVTESRLAPLDPASGIGVQLTRQIGSQLGDDLIALYVQKLQNDLGSRVDPRVLQQAVGGGGS